MSDARTAILARVRQGQRTGRVPVAARASNVAAPAALAYPEILRRFTGELQALGVDCFVEATADAVRARVSTIVAAQSVLCWDAEQLPYEVGSLFGRAATGNSPRDVQATAAIGVTGCDGAIAETGSLALLSGPGKPRAASLLPPVHLAVVRAADLYFSMGEFFAAQATAIAEAACCTFITGPSRTADIELTLTVGVHGPGRVAIVVGP